MKREFNKRTLGLQLGVLVLGAPLAVYVAYITVIPWAERIGDGRILEWQRLQDEGASLIRAGRFDEAEVSFRAALNYAENAFLMHPYFEGDSALSLGGILFTQNRLDEARIYYNRDLLIREEVAGEYSPELCLSLKRLAEICLETSEFDAALDYAKRAVAIRERQDLSPNPELPAALRSLAQVYEKQEDDPNARQVRERIASLEAGGMKDG